MFVEQWLKYILTQIFGELFCDILIEYHVYENYFSRRWQRCKRNLCSTPFGERMTEKKTKTNEQNYWDFFISELGFGCTSVKLYLILILMCTQKPRYRLSDVYFCLNRLMLNIIV